MCDILVITILTSLVNGIFVCYLTRVLIVSYCHILPLLNLNWYLVLHLKAVFHEFILE